MCEGAIYRMCGSLAGMAIVGAGLHGGAAFAKSGAMTEAEIRVFRNSIAKCWAPPQETWTSGFVVRINVEMTAEGDLAVPPKILNRQPSDLYDRLAKSALDALRDCQPYQVPWEGHESWKAIIINFDPREFGGDAEAADAGSPTPPGAIEDGVLPQGEGWEKVGW